MAQISILKNSKVRSNTRLLGLAVFIIVINILFYFVLWQYHVWSPFALVSLSLFFLVLFQYKKQQQLLLRQKNAQIIQLLISSGFPHATLHSKKKVFQKDFVRSGLYDNFPFIYTGNNLIKTKKWVLSNITASKHLAKNKETIIVFDGVFAKVKNQLPIDGLLIIKPLMISDKTEIPEVLQSLMHRYFTPEVKNRVTGNTVFDEKFEVFSSSTELQNKVLTPNVISVILEIESKLHPCIYTGHDTLVGSKKKKPAMEISFVENYIYVGIRGLKLFNSSGNHNIIFEAEGFQKCIEFIQLINQINNKPNKI